MARRPGDEIWVLTSFLGTLPGPPRVIAQTFRGCVPTSLWGRGPSGLQREGTHKGHLPSLSNLVGPPPGHGEPMRKPPSASKEETEGLGW